MLCIDEYGKSTKTYQLGDKLESIVDLTNIYRLETFFNLFTYSKQVKLCPNIVLLCYILSQYTYNVYIFVMCRNGT